MSATNKRILVTGREGQVIQSLIERQHFHDNFEIIALGRPNLDLSRPDEIDGLVRVVRPDVIVSAAAYTAVDKAEADEEFATAVNGIGAGALAVAAANLGVPIIHLSTDYVFDGTKAGPYNEKDPVAPIGAYGRSKLAGEFAVAKATPDHVILRTAWVYSPFGANFLKTILRLAKDRDTISVVDDQIGNPTSALDIADCVLAVANNLLERGAPELRGIFHMTGSGEASWADFAEAIFAEATAHGIPGARINRITSDQYPTPAKRPANSRLDCQHLQDCHGVRLPYWTESFATVVRRLASFK